MLINGWALGNVLLGQIGSGRVMALYKTEEARQRDVPFVFECLIVRCPVNSERQVFVRDLIALAWARVAE